jgi:type III secretion protein X
MSDFRIGSGPFFDRGIDKITFKGQEAMQGLPEQRELTPAEHAQRPQLEQLLHMPNLESFLEEAIRPEFDDPELLTPGRFKQAMDGALAAIRQAAEQQQAHDPDGAKVLNRAGRLLNEEVNLRDLLQMYRSVLLQG